MLWCGASIKDKYRSDNLHTDIFTSSLVDIVNLGMPGVDQASYNSWTQQQIDDFYLNSITCEDGFFNNSWTPDEIFNNQLKQALPK